MVGRIEDVTEERTRLKMKPAERAIVLWNLV